MNIRVSYMRTPTDGFCVAESFDVLNLPRIGDNVFLPETLLDVFREHGELVTGPLGPARRYRVVGVEHRWDDIAEKPYVSITRLDNLEHWPAWHTSQ